MKTLIKISVLVFSLNASAGWWDVSGLRGLSEPVGKAIWNRATSQCGVQESSAGSWSAGVRLVPDPNTPGAWIYAVVMRYDHDGNYSFVREELRWTPGEPRAEVLRFCCGFTDCRLP